MTKTILVTGGAGFIGGAVVRRLVGDGRRVVNLDKLTYAGCLASLADIENQPDYLFVQGDVCNDDLVRSLFAEQRPSAVLHLAAESHVDRSIDGPAAFVHTNVVGTQTLLHAALDYWRELSADAKDAFRFLHVSTDEVYGSLGPEGLFRETTPYDPSSPYSASKAAADHFARAYARTFGLPVLVTNCSNNYGPYQYPEKLIPVMILNAAAGRTLPVYGDGGNVRDWLHVEDHVDALLAVLDRGTPGETYNIGGNSERTNLQIVKTICQCIDELCDAAPTKPCEQLIQFVTDRPGHDRRYAIDASKIERELGWRPRRTFESALRETVQWYLDNQKWVAAAGEAAQQRERIGLG